MIMTWQLDADTVLHRVAATADPVHGGITHVVVHCGRRAWIDCHAPSVADDLQAPELILHTHVQPEHCAEGSRFPHARIVVPMGTRTLACDPATWRREAATTWDDPEAWGETRGRERWGIAGAITHWPPDVPLPNADEARAGTTIDFGDCQFEAVALPAHSPYALGWILSRASQVLAVFCGDLVRHPGTVVNLRHLEYGYGHNALAEMPAMLRGLTALGTPFLYPASGPAVAPRDALALAGRIEAFLQASTWRSPDWYDRPPLQPIDRLGRWSSVAPGVWQMDQFGNPVLFIRPDGHALMVDPGPCDFTNPRRDSDFAVDLDRFHAERGLRSVDWALITHIHGDHVDQCAALRRRYGCRVAASRLVAEVIADPRRWPYPALLPWYGLGQEAVPVDAVISEGGSWSWDGLEIACLHLPGHCHAHAGYLLDWAGDRVAITGDVVQVRGEAMQLDLGCLANHTVWRGRPGAMTTCERLLGADITLNLGGHGSHFRDCDAIYQESLQRMVFALPLLRALVPAGDLDRAVDDGRLMPAGEDQRVRHAVALVDQMGRTPSATVPVVM